MNYVFNTLPVVARPNYPVRVQSCESWGLGVNMKESYTSTWSRQTTHGNTFIISVIELNWYWDTRETGEGDYALMRCERCFFSLSLSLSFPLSLSLPHVYLSQEETRHVHHNARWGQVRGKGIEKKEIGDLKKGIREKERGIQKKETRTSHIWIQCTNPAIHPLRLPSSLFLSISLSLCRGGNLLLNHVR